MMMQGLSRTPLVIIMEKEYSATADALELFLKRNLTGGILNVFISAISLFFIGQWIAAVIHTITTVMIFLWIIKTTIQNTNLKRVGKIMFDGMNYGLGVNEMDVFETTRSLCEMRGRILGMSKLLDIYNLSTSIMCIIFVLNFFIKLLGG